MATTTQYNPQIELNQKLYAAGASKTIYALVTPETEVAKADILGNATVHGVDSVRAAHLEQFREAWTGKQDGLHKAFFDKWLKWSAPLVDMNPSEFPYCYPTSGASEPLYHLVADYGNRARVQGFTPRIHIFKGEYEGYKAYAEASGITVVEHDRRDWKKAAATLPENELFFLSQPSAIDGNVWHECNEFLRLISTQSKAPRVIMDMTYVGAIPEAPPEKFALKEPCVRNVVFSLSKPFGTYYDRIGGVFCREQDSGLFGNQWFKNLTSLQLGLALMERHGVFDLPHKYRDLQRAQAKKVGAALGLKLKPADVYILATAADAGTADPQLANYLRRPAGDPSARIRVCLTPGMAEAIGTAGPVRGVVPHAGTVVDRAP